MISDKGKKLVIRYGDICAFVNDFMTNPAEYMLDDHNSGKPLVDYIATLEAKVAKLDSTIIELIEKGQDMRFRFDHFDPIVEPWAELVFRIRNEVKE